MTDDEDTFEPIRKSRSRTRASGVNSGKEKRIQQTAKMGFHKHQRTNRKGGGQR